MRTWEVTFNEGGLEFYILTLNCEETWACVKYNVINFISEPPPQWIGARHARDPNHDFLQKRKYEKTFTNPKEVFVKALLLATCYIYYLWPYVFLTPDWQPKLLISPAAVDELLPPCPHLVTRSLHLCYSFIIRCFSTTLHNRHKVEN